MSLTTLETAAARTRRKPHTPTFSPRLMRAARKGCGLNFDELGLLIGRNARTVRRYESGHILPPADVIGALHVTLRVAIADLFE